MSKRWGISMGFTWGIFLNWKALLLIILAFLTVFTAGFPQQAFWLYRTIAEMIWNALANL